MRPDVERPVSSESLRRCDLGEDARNTDLEGSRMQDYKSYKWEVNAIDVHVASFGAKASNI